MRNWQDERTEIACEMHEVKIKADVKHLLNFRFEMKKEKKNAHNFNWGVSRTFAPLNKLTVTGIQCIGTQTKTIVWESMNAVLLRSSKFKQAKRATEYRYKKWTEKNKNSFAKIKIVCDKNRFMSSLFEPIFGLTQWWWQSMTTACINRTAQWRATTPN